jgi:sarcosine oxidase subunit gamma
MRRRGALDGTGEAVRASSPAAAIRVLPPQCRLVLRIEEAAPARIFFAAGFALKFPINRFVAAGANLSARLGPDEWLLLARDGEEREVAARVGAALAGYDHAIFDIGHRHAGFELSGPRAADVLNAGCPLDLTPRRFPTGSATRTLLGKAEIVLMRMDGAPTFRLECARSLARYVDEFLAEAAREFVSR